MNPHHNPTLVSAPCSGLEKVHEINDRHKELHAMKNLYLTFSALVLSLSAAQSNTISESQQPYVKQYEKQKTVPKPEEMLLNTDAEPDLKTGFTPLFNGKNLSGWIQKGGNHSYEVGKDMIIGTCVNGEANAFLCTERTDYANFIFTCEIKWEVDGNSGVMFRARTKVENGGNERVCGPQCEMEGINNARCWSSGIYGEAVGGWLYPLWLDAHKEVRDALVKDGWNRVTILADGDTVKTWLNGTPSAHWKTTEYMQGFFGLQIHAGKQGKILFRNINVKEL
jgi:hypothetical protein